MIWIRAIAVLLAVLVGGFLVVVNFSSVETRYKCPGTLYSANESAPETAYIRVQRYRPWVGLWSESDGNLLLEFPHKAVEHFGQLEASSINLQIGTSDAPFKGIFSTVSNTITVNTHLGQFQGTCKVVAADA